MPLPVIDTAPLPVPIPAPAPAPVRIANPLIGVTPALVAAPAGLQLAVVAGGVRLPAVEVAQAAPVIEERPKSAFLPAEVEPVAPKAPVVPVYPRKQARH